MRATTWKGAAALLFVPALLAIAFFYWVRVGDPGLQQATIGWLFVVFVPIVSLSEIAALRGWVDAGTGALLVLFARG